MGVLLLTSARARSQPATVYLMEHFHRCLQPICEVPLKGVPCLYSMHILVAFRIQIPATAWPCKQPDQSAEWQNTRTLFSQISLLHDHYCQSKGWARAPGWMQCHEWNSRFSYSLKSAQPWRAINKKYIFQMYWAASFADKSTKLDHHWRDLDLNQLAICPTIASLPLKLNIRSSSPIKMKYILTTSHSCFHKGQSEKMYS